MDGPRDIGTRSFDSSTTGGSMTPDAQLVEAARGGDRDAFATLAERYRGRVYATALTLLRNEEDARDVAQESFLRAYRGLATLDQPDRFGSWVVGIAAHASRDVRRRKGIERGALEEVIRRRQEAQKAILDAAAAHAPAAAGVISAGGLDPEIERRLTGLVGALPDQARRAIKLRYEVGMTYKEIAEEMEVPTSTVRGILHRATSTLRNRLRPHLPPGVATPTKTKTQPSVSTRGAELDDSAEATTASAAAGERGSRRAQQADAEHSGSDSEEVVS